MLELVKHLEDTGVYFEVIFVENGSTDRTPDLLAALTQAHRNLRMLTTATRDYSTSIIKGITAARGDFIITTGIDFTDLGVIERCLDALKESDIVICSKNLGIDGRPFVRRLANRGYNVLVKVIFRMKFSDVEGYHGLRRKRVQDMVAGMNARAHFFNLWLLLYARRQSMIIREVPLYVRELRPSKFSQGPKVAYLAFLSLIEFAKLKGKGF